jgi:hypothetical protein
MEFIFVALINFLFAEEKRGRDGMQKKFHVLQY